MTKVSILDHENNDTIEQNGGNPEKGQLEGKNRVQTCKLLSVCE